MTKEDVKEYIEENGNAQLVIDTVKEMHAQGASMTIDELDKRIHPPIIEKPAEPKAPEKYVPSYTQDAKFQAIINEDYSQAQSSKKKIDSSTSSMIKVYLGYIFGPLILMLPSLLLNSGRTPTGMPWDIINPACTIIGLIICIIASIAPIWTIFEKANQPGWFAIIPIYDIFVLCRIVYDKPILGLLYFVPGVNVIMNITTNYLLARCFDKSTVFSAVYAVLTPLLSPVMAYDDSFYTGPAM